MKRKEEIFRGSILCLVLCIPFLTLLPSAASAATPAAIENAIETGVAWLAAQQDTTNGYWEDGSNRAGPTGLALVKLQERAFELGYTPFDPSYPYKQNVEKGLAYLFSILDVMNISTQPAGNPDTDGDGIGVFVDDGYATTYDTGITIMAIASSRAPDRIVNAPGSQVNGWTYKQVLVDMVNYMAYGQYDYAPSRGGWGYFHNSSNVDNSNSGYAVSGLGYAQSVKYGFECVIPQFVKDELILWADYVQTDGGAEDGGSGYTAPGAGNILRTGNLVCQMTFAGRSADHTNVQRAVGYIGRKWNESNQNPGWGNPAYYSGSPYYQAMYCTANGLSYARIDTIPVDGQPRDWYADFADALVNAQQGSGCWPADPYGGNVLATAWALLALERPAYILDFEKTDNVDENDCRSPGQEITYTICWNNQGDRTFTDCWIIDRLPQGVTYTGGQWLYDPNEHTCIIDIGDIGPFDANCVSLTVEVNYKAEPGMNLHNVAEMFAGDSLIAWATEDTPVCCWDTGPIIYVDKDATGNNNGVSWIDAYTYLQDALARARDTQCADVNMIYIADGTYSPGVLTSSSFSIPDGISVYGSFAGAGFPDPYFRDTKAFPTILSGYISDTARNDTAVQMGDNSLLDGVTVKEAAAYGIYGSGADFIIENCRVEDNKEYGVYAENGDISIKWCSVKNNGYDGIRHIGNGKSVAIENCQIYDNQRNGLYLKDSVFTVSNNVICKSGVEDIVYFGIWLENPISESVVHNNTIAYNYNEAIYYSDIDPNHVNAPDTQNCILYYNNDWGDQFAGTAFATHYCCIQDPNDPDGMSETYFGDYNFSHKPDFAYGTDPNNIHLAYTSYCKNRGNPYLSYEGQLDIDKEQRVADTYADVGADEVHCPDVYNERDWNADGVVNLEEFVHWSRSWLSHDPNDPYITTDPNNIGQPNYADPNTIAQWRLTWNPRCDLNSDYNVNLPDLIIFVDDTPWLWTACWKQQELLEQQQMQQMSMMMGGGGQTIMSSTPSTSLEPLQSAETATPAIVEPIEIVPATELIEPIEIDPVVERENLLSLVEDINALINAGGDDAQAWQEMKILLEQTLVDMEDTTNEPNEF